MNKSKKNEVPDEAMIAAIEGLLAPSVKLEFIYILKKCIPIVKQTLFAWFLKMKSFF